MSAGAAQRWKQQRFNPLRSVTPASLAAMIDQFDSGYLRSAAMAWEEMCERDDTLSVVAPKRSSQTARRRWDIVIGEEVPETQQAEAEAHQAALKFFYSNLAHVNAVDRNQRGGVRGLITRVMEAKRYRYSAHEIEWRPSASGITATFHYVPLAFLENTTGELAWSGVEGNYPGKPIDRADWLIAASDNCLMKAASVCYMFKRLSLQDWLNFSEKFGIPGIHGETNAAKDSPEWVEFVNALEAFANDFIIATTTGSKINLIEVGKNGDGPFAPMVDRMDRALARMFLGSDLATMSRENGAGASLQDEAADEIIADDCEFISELFQQELDKKVIEWNFGPGTQPLAFFRLTPPSKEDTKLEMEVDKHLRDFGVPFDPAELAERYNRTITEDAEAIQTQRANAAKKSGAEGERETAGANERPLTPALSPQAGRGGGRCESLVKGLRADLQPLRDTLLRIEGANGADQLRGRALEIAAGLPDLEIEVMARTGADEAFQALVGAEFLNGLASLGKPETTTA